eukprot:8972634-Karenia_brevis.AAC.1
MDSVKWVRWAAWRRYKDAEDADGDLPGGVPDEEREAPDPHQSKEGPKVIYVQTRTKEALFGPDGASKKTRGCQGCDAPTRGMAYQPHTHKCRERFTEMLKDSAKVRHQKARMEEFKKREHRRMEEHKKMKNKIKENNTIKQKKKKIKEKMPMMGDRTKEGENMMEGVILMD